MALYSVEGRGGVVHSAIVLVMKGLIIKVWVITADIRGNRARYWNGGRDWFVERG